MRYLNHEVKRTSPNIPARVMAKKKILFIHEKFGRMAGAEQHIIVAAPFLCDAFELNLLYWTRTGKDEELVARWFDNTIQMNFDGPDDEVRSSLKAALADLDPDIIYMHKCLSPVMLETLLESRIPIVRMVHDHEVYCMRTYKYFPWSRKICTRKAGLCCLVPCLAFIQRDRTKGEFGIKYVSYLNQQRLIKADQQITASFVVTTFMRDELIRQGYPPNRIFIFPPTPRNLTEEAPTPAFTDDNILVFAGQIIRGKGLDVLIKSLALVKTPFKLIVLGEGSHKAYCQQLTVSLGLQDKIEFKGFIPHEALQEYYRQATAAIVPSVWPEPIATWGLEVMRYGLPVLGFDSGGISDWLKDGHTGYLIPWMNLNVMAEKIDYLLTHKDEARRMGENARQFIFRHYNFDDYIDRLRSKLVELAK